MGASVLGPGLIVCGVFPVLFVCLTTNCWREFFLILNLKTTWYCLQYQLGELVSDRVLAGAAFIYGRSAENVLWTHILRSQS